MLLHRIKIKGFKSFADEVELELERGITAVVGPNGCGKSNIADSINWALGEQSPTSLRGKKMEHMIFNGSSSRKASGMAEVTITLRTSADFGATLDFGEQEEVEGLERDGAGLADLLQGTDGEVSVTRRMYRDTQSEYLINGRSCRLKDIQDLLMALGIGTRAITVIEQDRIISMISAKPVERRSMIEDAAGITKFKVNRHLTSLKLEHTQNNLARIDDLLSEQEIHVNALQRQAQRTRRFRRLQEEIRRIEAGLLAIKHFELTEQQRAVGENLAALEQRYAAALASLSLTEGEEATLRQELDETAARKVQKREEFYRNNLEIDRGTNRLKHLRDSLDALFARSEETSRRLDQNRVRLEEREREQLENRHQVQKLQAELSTTGQQLSLLQERAEGADADVDTLRRRRDELARNLSRAREDRAAENSRRESHQRDEQRVAQTAANALALKDKAQAGLSELEDRITHLAGRADDLEQRQMDNAAALTREQSALAACKAELEAAERRLDTLRTSRGAAEATLTALREMEEQLEGIDEAARLIILDKDLKARVRPLGLAADWVQVDPRRAAAIIAVYEQLLTAVVVPDAAAAETGIAALRERNAGRATFIAADRLPEAAGTAHGDLRAAIKPKDEFGARLLSLFPPALSAGSTRDALALSAERPGIAAVSADGSVCRDGLLVRGGGESSGAKLFARRERMEELAKELAAVTAEIDTMIARRDEIAEREREVRTTLENLRREGEQFRLQAVELTAQGKAARADRDRRQEALQQLEDEIDRFTRQRQDAAAAIKNSEERLASLDGQIATLNGEFTALDEMLSTKAEFAGEVRRQESALRSTIGAVEERIRAAMNREQALIKDCTDIRRGIDEAGQELERIEEQRAAILADIESTEKDLPARVDAGKVMEEELRVIDAALDDLGARNRVAEAALRQQRKDLAALQTDLEAARLAAREHEVALEHLRTRAAENLSMTEEELAEIQKQGLPENYDEAVSTLADLKEKVEALGAVNLLAEEEYQEHLERFQKLKGQRQDVIDSIAALEKVIDRIDRISRQRFREAFEKINENFHRLFRLLFRGGKAELVLAEGDLLEAGLEIMVQPPGKRPQSATLLSGGEKSLAAFALILAVMEYRPTPFCVLDESDAALDEANIRRIAGVLRERADTTQFIVVTHNKTTMEIADRLYGVTMEEPGVSRLVSVSFN